MANTPFQSILCPVDFSDCSSAALSAASALAAACGAPLTVLHAVHIEVPAYLTSGSAGEILRQLVESRNQAREELARWARPLVEGNDVEFLVDERAPVEAILDCAGRMRAPWIVMGTHGRTGLERLLLGSVTERTLRAAHHPVVTIPPRTAS